MNGSSSIFEKPYGGTSLIEQGSDDGNSEIASSIGRSSIKRMSRKERQERKSFCIGQHKIKPQQAKKGGNEENRLPSASGLQRHPLRKTLDKASGQLQKQIDVNFDVMDDPDYPVEAINSNIIVEEIEMNGRIQKIFKKTYYLIDGKTINITRIEQA